jgi:pyridoxamine 5'-phosphate oxidase
LVVCAAGELAAVDAVENGLSDPYLAHRLPDELPADPMHWAAAWLDEATRQSVQRNPNAMNLATLGSDGRPSARVVLCKEFVPDPGYLVFYTNYRSRKVAELRANPQVAVTFHWDALGRQVRIEGAAVFSPAAESDAYFASRDPGSQLGAWGSDQSAPLASREALLRQLAERARQLGLNLDDAAQSIETKDRKPVARPPHWGGVRVWARAIELWIEGQDRIHDRARWERRLEQDTGHGFATGDWQGTRLQP